MGYRVVHDLTRNFTSKNHHVFCNNFFTSVSLAEDLLNNNIYQCGTTSAHREDFPKELAANNAQVKHLKQGESLFRRREDLVTTVRKDERFVHFLSTLSNPTGEETVNQKQQDGTIIQVLSVTRSVAWLLCRRNKIEKMVAVSFLVLCGCKHC